VSNFYWAWRYSCLKLACMCVDFLQNELPLLLEEVPLDKRICMALQHDGAPTHYSCLVTHHLNFNIPWMMDRPQWLCSVATKVPRPYSFRFVSVGMDEKQSLQTKSKHKGWFDNLHHESAALLKHEHQDHLRRATRTVVKRVEKCT
jgi:hypothetical protein